MASARTIKERQGDSREVSDAALLLTVLVITGGGGRECDRAETRSSDEDGAL